MRRAILSVLLCLLASQAPAAPASAESVERLLQVTRTESMIESIYAAMEQTMRGSMQQATMGTVVTREQQRAMDAMPAKFMAVVREQFSWETMRPQYVQLYRETFSQEEVDGFVAFYESDTGQAFVNKMPIVMQKSIAISQAKMKTLIPKMNEAIAQAVREAKGIN